MKKIVLLSALALCASAAMADETGFNVTTKSGEGHSYSIDNIVNITFDGDDMVINHAEGTTRHNINDIERIMIGVFTGVEEVKDFDLENGLNVAIERGVLTARFTDADITLRIYDLNGRLVDMTAANDELSYNLAELNKGTYVLIVNDKVFKFMR